MGLSKAPSAAAAARGLDLPPAARRNHRRGPRERWRRGVSVLRRWAAAATQRHRQHPQGRRRRATPSSEAAFGAAVGDAGTIYSVCQR